MAHWYRGMGKLEQPGYGTCRASITLANTGPLPQGADTAPWVSHRLMELDSIVKQRSISWMDAFTDVLVPQELWSCEASPSCAR